MTQSRFIYTLKVLLKEKLQEKFFFNSLLLLIPFAVFTVTTRFKVLNPKVDGWLSIGDGSSEIAWEFYRNTKFPNWLIGDLSSYGLEMSRPLFYTLPTFFVWPARFFSFALGERFQLVGIMILLNLILIYFFATKIFTIFNFSKFSIAISSSIILLAPILHSRYIDHTHYFIISHWIILATFYLVLRDDTSWIKWSLLFVISILNFPYFTIFILVIGTFYFLKKIIFKEIKLNKLIKLFLGLIFSSLFASIITGYIFFGNILRRDTEIIFKANLNSLLNPLGWSRILPDLPLNSGEYEGFAFLGLSTLFLAVVLCVTTLQKLLQKKIIISIQSINFFILFIPSIFLAFISLSNEVAWGPLILFSYPENWFYQFVSLNFRSLGRFIWALVYFLMIYIIYRLNLTTTRIFFSTVLALALALGVWDSSPKLTSQRLDKFSFVYVNPLKSKFWSQLSDCYDNIISVPPVTTAELLYPLAKHAFVQNLNLYPAYIPRVPAEEQLLAQMEMRKNIKNGIFEDKSIYVFQEAKFVITEITELDKKIAINTMSGSSRAGTINKTFVIATNFEDCDSLNQAYSSKLNIRQQKDFLVDKQIDFVGNDLAKSFLLSGWSEIEDWGVWSIGEKSELLLQVSPEKNWSHIEINGQRYLDNLGQGVEMEIYVNNSKKISYNKSANKAEKIIIPISEEEKGNENFYIEFKFTNPLSPQEDSGLADSRRLGYGLKTITLE